MRLSSISLLTNCRSYCQEIHIFLWLASGIWKHSEHVFKNQLDFVQCSSISHCKLKNNFLDYLVNWHLRFCFHALLVIFFCVYFDLYIPGQSFNCNNKYFAVSACVYKSHMLSLYWIGTSTQRNETIKHGTVSQKEH